MTLYTEHVDRLLRDLGIKLHTRYKSSPIHLTQIVSVFNIKVEHLPYDKDVSGTLVKCNKGTYIFINEFHHYKRRRFSLGHEFGHYYLNHPPDVSTLLQDDLHKLIESEANKFSSCILMPRQLIAGLAKENTCIPELAHWFRVSEIAAAIRCRELGYRVYEADEIISQYWLERGDADNPEWSMEQLEISHV